MADNATTLDIAVANRHPTTLTSSLHTQTARHSRDYVVDWCTAFSMLVSCVGTDPKGNYLSVLRLPSSGIVTHVLREALRRGAVAPPPIDFYFRQTCLRSPQNIPPSVHASCKSSQLSSSLGTLNSRFYPFSGSGRATHFDSLDKGLTVFRMPIGYEPAQSVKTNDRSRLSLTTDSGSSDTTMNDGEDPGPIGIFDPDVVHRRLDLIFAPPESYWTAVVGWYALVLVTTALSHNLW